MAGNAMLRREDFDTAGKLRGKMWFIYPVFAVHMLMFGLSGFWMSYADLHPPLAFVYLHGGLAIFAYMTFYATIFGRDEVKWLIINAALGVLGIYSQLGWILSKFGKHIADYPWYVHVTPFMYYVLYTFLLRQFLLDLTNSRLHPVRRSIVNNLYVMGSILLYGWALLENR